MQKDFFTYQAQTTRFAAGFEIDRAEGSYIYGTDGKKYLDFVAGVSANTLGHSHPKVINAIKNQADKYLHVMVYGEYAQEMPVQLCKLLAEATPEPLEVTYLVNSGAEAIDGALKLAKRYTGREEIISMKQSYHGNTHGALSVSGNELHKREFRPLLPLVDFIEFNNTDEFSKITEKTACVIAETIQGAAGFLMPDQDYFPRLKKRCEEVGALLILDEIQPGFGRTGKLFASGDGQRNGRWCAGGRFHEFPRNHGNAFSYTQAWAYYDLWRQSAHRCGQPCDAKRSIGQ